MIGTIIIYNIYMNKNATDHVYVRNDFKMNIYLLNHIPILRIKNIHRILVGII